MGSHLISSWFKKVAASCLLGILFPVSSLASANITVAIENMMFTPAFVSVKKGDRIVWMNKDLVPHTVTAEDHSFNSKAIAPGKSWKFRVPKAGHFNYKCDFHPVMKGAFEANGDGA